MYFSLILDISEEGYNGIIQFKRTAFKNCSIHKSIV